MPACSSRRACSASTERVQRRRFGVAAGIWLVAGVGLLVSGMIPAVMIPAVADEVPTRCAPVAGPIGAPQLCQLALADGVHQRVLVLTPPEPRAVLVMFPGGTGQLGLGNDGHFAHGANVLVRTRADWVAQGFAVVIADAPTSASLRGARSTAAFGAAARRLITFVHDRFKLPLFVVGTSQGAIAAVNAAADAPTGLVAGVVLTETVSRRGGSGETVFDAHPDGVTVPVLVVANAADACPVAAPEDAPRIAAAFTRALHVQVLNVSGGRPGKRACGSFSPHGYWGMEEQVIGAIGGWIDRTLQAPRAP